MTLTDFHKHYVDTSKNAQAGLKKLNLFDSTTEEKADVTSLLTELIDMFRTADAIGDVIAQFSPVIEPVEELEELPAGDPSEQ